MRLIDADKMRENLEWCKTQAPTDNFWDDAIERLDVQPTVEAVPLEPLARFIVENLDPRVDCKTCATIREGWEDRECANCPKMSDEEVLDALKKWMKETNAQTVGAVPAVHGKWITDRTFEHDGEWYCSVCGYEPTVFENTPYCPECGAKMGGGGE